VRSGTIRDNTFMKSGMDVLVLGDCVIDKAAGGS
jgi:hypothetical protein